MDSHEHRRPSRSQCLRAQLCVPARASEHHRTLGCLVLAALSEKTHRFSELRRHVDGISERMLSQTLQTLERDGLVHREVLTTIPRMSSTRSPNWDTGS